MGGVASTLPSPIEYLQSVLFLGLVVALAVGWMLYGVWRRGRAVEVAFLQSRWGLTGGGEGTYFFDADVFLGDPENVDRLTQWFPAVLRSIRREIGPVNWLGFIEKDGGPVGMLTAKDLLTAKSGVPSVTIRLQRRLLACTVKIPRDAASRRGTMVIVSDVLTTSRTLRRAIERATTAGFDVRYAVVLYDREGGGQQVLTSMGVPVKSMLGAAALAQARERRESGCVV